MPQRTALHAPAREQLELAAGAGGGRTAHTVYGGHGQVRVNAGVVGVALPAPTDGGLR